MKRQHKIGARPTIRRREIAHLGKLDEYRQLRQDKTKFFYDPVYDLNHSLPLMFIEQECAFYGYEFYGHTTMEEKILDEHETDGEIVIRAGKYAKEISFNEYIYKYPTKDVAHQFLEKVLYPIFNEIAQLRISDKRSKSLDREKIIDQLHEKSNRGLEELRNSGSEFYYWPIYDLLESAACCIDAIASIETHTDFFLEFCFILRNGMKYGFTPHDFASVNHCIKFFDTIIWFEQHNLDINADDVTATRFVNELMREAIFPVKCDDVLIRKEGGDPYCAGCYSRQLATTVLGHAPIPIPDGYVVCSE